MPWPRGELDRSTSFIIVGEDGVEQPLQSWPLAYWPDGSLKWSGHALPPEPRLAAPVRVRPAPPARPSRQPMVSATPNGLHFDTGQLRGDVPNQGTKILSALVGPNKSLLEEAQLVAVIDDGLADEQGDPVKRKHYCGEVTGVTLEQNGDSRAVIKIAGSHRLDSVTALPFELRLYFYRDNASIRLVHSLIYDQNPARAFVRGIGLALGVPMRDALYDRHIRFVSAEGGVFAESIRGVSGLRRDAGANIAANQVGGKALPPLSSWSPQVAERLNDIPAFGYYSLLQASADGYTIRKRSTRASGWIDAASGNRASGGGYLGSPSGGIAFGIRHFWQSHPGQIDIEAAETDKATINLWLWAPRADPMDLRAYRTSPPDNAGQRHVLDITYEDPEPNFNTPFGIGRSSEITLRLLSSTPSAEQLLEMDQQVQAPPQLTVDLARLQACQVFDSFVAPADPRTPLDRQLEQGLAWCFDFYQSQVEQRRWYGFWNYGDVMHSYDVYRHTWRYDVGGFAWDNGELSTEIWLWHYFLHSGRAEVYRMAEAMTRHTSEVDVHHIGPYSPLGSRHDVQHWGDSAKQLRVSTVANHRFFYYLSTDERIGDLLQEQLAGPARLRQIVAGRKIDPVLPAYDTSTHARVSFGTDWGAIAAAWLTAWERTGDEAWRARLLASMQSIAAQPHGFFTGIGDMELSTGRFELDQTGAIRVSHLSAVFGLAEICSELIRLIPDRNFRQAWIAYCQLYSASAGLQEKVLGQSLGKLNLSQAHARLLGYAGQQLAQAKIQQTAWRQFLAGRAGIRFSDQQTQRVVRPDALRDVDEAPRISTNAVAQWALGAMGLLAVAHDQEPTL